MKELILKCRNNKSVRFLAKMNGADLVVQSFTAQRKFDFFTFSVAELSRCRIEADRTNNCCLWVGGTAFEIEVECALMLSAQIDIKKAGKYFDESGVPA